MAQYCKEELEKYSGIVVYMTRFSNNVDMDRYDRVKVAKDLGADALVSLHINSTGNQQDTVSGALAYVPISSNKADYAVEARALAADIVSNLSTVGMKNLGYLKGEGLGIIYYGRQWKIPTMIIEHGFVNNPSDCLKYYGSDAKIKAVAVADAFGVLPPVSILTEAQTQYYFLSGFTAKLAGTERGITEPTPTFSACFGQAFLELHPTKYAEELVKKMEKSGAKAYLVNTGWNGTGKRISIKDTRGIIDAILNGAIKNAPTKTIPYFNFEVPTELPGVDPAILDPRDTYADASEWETKAKDLADRFIKNFAKYEGNAAGKALVSAGPQK